MKKKTL